MKSRHAGFIVLQMIGTRSNRGWLTYVCSVWFIWRVVQGGAGVVLYGGLRGGCRDDARGPEKAQGQLSDNLAAAVPDSPYQKERKDPPRSTWPAQSERYNTWKHNPFFSHHLIHREPVFCLKISLHKTTAFLSIKKITKINIKRIFIYLFQVGFPFEHLWINL